MKAFVGIMSCFIVASSCGICFAKEYKCVNVSKIEFTESDGSELKLISIGKKQLIFEINEKSQKNETPNIK